MPTEGARRRWWQGKRRSSLLAAVAVLGLLVLLPLLAADRAIALAAAVRLSALTPADSSRWYAVYVADYGYHTAIFVEQPRDWALGHADAEPDSAGSFAEYAWGDRRFYMESRYAPWSVFATLFLPTEAVAYAAHHLRAPDQSLGLRALHRRDVSAAEMLLLTTQLERWIVRDDDGARARAFTKVPGYRGRFHRAFGRYSWWRNCNRWTLEQLAVIGASRERVLVVTPAHVVSRLQGFASISLNEAAEGSRPSTPTAPAVPATTARLARTSISTPTATTHSGDAP